jgi:hypothetical protein
MRRFARWHIWLGWLVALPILIWIASGLFMSAKPIEEVRGENLRQHARPIDGSSLKAPQLAGTVTKVALVDQVGSAVWVVTGTDKSMRRYDARTGIALNAIAEAEARRIALDAFSGDAKLATIVRFSADQSPLDLRKPRPSWQVSFDDGTHLYIDADTGEVLALRTRWWRVYDFLWGLHIMDLETRENAHNPWVWTLGGLAFVSSLMGTALLFRRRRRAR